MNVNFQQTLLTCRNNFHQYISNWRQRLQISITRRFRDMSQNWRKNMTPHTGNRTSPTPFWYLEFDVLRMISDISCVVLLTTGFWRCINSFYNVSWTVSFIPILIYKLLFIVHVDTFSYLTNCILHMMYILYIWLLIYTLQCYRCFDLFLLLRCFSRLLFLF